MTEYIKERLEEVKVVLEEFEEFFSPKRYQFFIKQTLRMAGALMQQDEREANNATNFISNELSDID